MDEFVTLPMLRKLSEYWDEHPPMHILLQGFMGAFVTTEKSAPKKQAKPKGPADLMARMKELNG